MNPISVALARCDRYDPHELDLCIDRLIGQIDDNQNYSGKKVLLKPNLISSRSPALACTHRNVVEAVSRWFVDQGAAVSVGDSPAFGSTDSVCRRHRMTEGLGRLGVEIVNFDEKITTRLPSGVEVPLARQIVETDFLIGLPKVKAHNQMLVTLAVKNLFGTIAGIHKAKLHMVTGNSHSLFSSIILDLVEVMPPGFHLADGILAMHRSGPLDGDSFMLDCLAASQSPVALDTALLQVLNVPADRSPLWEEAYRRGLCGSLMSELTFPGLKPDDFEAKDFQPPDSLNPIRFNPFRFLGSIWKRIFLRKHN